MLASDAHAWGEVSYPGVGWSPSDPTAGAALAPPAQPSSLSRALDAVRSFASGPGGRLVLAAGLGVLVLVSVVAVWVVRWWRRRRHDGDAPGSAGPVLRAFRRLESAMTRTGTRSPPAETLAELAFRLPPADRGAVAVLERRCYGPRPPAEPEAAAAVATFERLDRGAGVRRSPVSPPADSEPDAADAPNGRPTVAKVTRE